MASGDVLEAKLREVPGVEQTFPRVSFPALVTNGRVSIGAIGQGVDAAKETRFFDALHEPPPALGITMPMQHPAWRYVVAHAGRTLRTNALAEAIGVTREHLSRTFASSGAPNLKRVIDLVRLIAAAELAKNPGYDIADVARILGFASSSHLSSTAQRVVGTRPASLSRLRAIDLVERFSQGRFRSRS